MYFCVFTSGRSAPFRISFKASLLVINSLNFWLSPKAFVFPSYVKHNFAEQSILGWKFSIFNVLSISSHF